MRRRSIFAIVLSCGMLIGILVVSGCGANPARLSQVRPVPTVPYLAPTVVPNATATAAATATPKPKPTATARPAGPPPPTPPPASIPPGPSPVGTVPNVG